MFAASDIYGPHECFENGSFFIQKLPDQQKEEWHDNCIFLHSFFHTFSRIYLIFFIFDERIYEDLKVNLCSS